MLPIRPATPTDMPAVVSLLTEAGVPYQDLQAQSLHQFLVACSGEKIVACIGMERYTLNALIRSLTVHPSFERQGIASHLLRTIEEQARAKGTASIYLLTTSATSFFLARGYKRIDRASTPVLIQRSTQFTALCPSQAACLYKIFS
jgi:amino-acid N-acetyltransferase